MVWRFAYIVYRPFFDFLCELLFDLPLPLEAGPLLLLGFTFLSAHFPHFLPGDSVIPAVMTQSCWASLGLPFAFFGLPYPFY